MAPLDFFSRLYHYYTKKDTPAISLSAAAGLSIIYTLIYVIPFYLSSKTRPSPQLPRDAPSVIRARIRAVTFSCILTGAITSYVGLQYAELSFAQLLRTFGLWPVALLDVIKTVTLVSILFAGPLFERCIVEGGWRDWAWGKGVRETFSASIGWRTYVAGPVSEEFVWRGLIIPLHSWARMRATKMVFVTPLYFGIAHIHHCYEFKLTHPNTPLLPAIFRSLIQFTYTSIFGFFAAFVFLRTGNLWAAILAHSFCNWMGLPRLWGRVEAPVPLAPPDLDRKEDQVVQAPTLTYSRLSLGWTVAYYVLLVAGVVGFYLNLYPLTESQYALVRPGP